MIMPITPRVIVSVAMIIIIARSVVGRIPVVIVRIITGVIISRRTDEDPKMDTCFSRLWNEGR